MPRARGELGGGGAMGARVRIHRLPPARRSTRYNSLVTHHNHSHTRGSGSRVHGLIAVCALDMTALSLHIGNLS